MLGCLNQNFKSFGFICRCLKCIFILSLQCSYVVQPCKDSTYNLPTIQFPHIPGKCYFDKPKSDNIILSKPPLPPALEYVKIFGFLAAGIFLIVFIWNCGHMVGLPALGGAPEPAQPTTTAEGAVIGGQVVSIMVTWLEGPVIVVINIYGPKSSHYWVVSTSASIFNAMSSRLKYWPLCTLQ